MNRKEFLSQLEQLLNDVSETERREAMEYYENYFEDAGPENEEKIIEELGSPRKVADSIKRDLFGENYNAYHEQNEHKKVQEQQAFEKQQKENKMLRNILIAVAIVITFPIWIGILGTLFGVVVGLLGAIFGITIAVIACVAAAIIIGFALLGIGLAKVFTGFGAVGLLVIGIGLVMLAIGILGLILVVWCIGKFVPWFIRGFVMLVRKVLFRKGAVV